MSDPDSPFAESRPMFRGHLVVLADGTDQDRNDFRDLWERAWRKEFLASPSERALDAELLAWAKRKAVSPWEWTPGGPICAFCQSKQWLAIGGFILNPEHTDTCLAVRANKP